MAGLVKRKVKPVEEEVAEEVKEEEVKEVAEEEKVEEKPTLAFGGCITSPTYEVKADRGTFTGLDIQEVRYFIESILRHTSKITITKL